jgi:hypothetical protein
VGDPVQGVGERVDEAVEQRPIARPQSGGDGGRVETDERVAHGAPFTPGGGGARRRLAPSVGAAAGPGVNTM